MARLVKLAQQGYDVRTAGDENLIYSSEWPLLKIYDAQPFNINDVTQPQVIATHDLGFPPVFWFFTNTKIDAWQNTGTNSADTRSEFFGATGGGSFGISNSQLTFTPQASTATGSLQGYYYIFANDLTKQFTAPITNVGATPLGSNAQRAFKLAKPGKSAHSNNLTDFVIHSDCRSPLIHSINPGIVSGGVFTAQHNLGYAPMFFGYTLSNGVYTLLATGSGGSTIFTSDNAKVQFSEGSSGRQMTIVILKDPFLIDYVVSVTV